MAVSNEQAIIGLDFLPIDRIQAAIARNDGTFIQEISDDAKAEELAGGYFGEWTEFSFSIGSAPGAARYILPIIRKVLQQQSIIYYEIDILEDSVNWWQVPLWGNYQVKIYCHGSLLPLWIIVTILLAVAAAIAFVTFQVRTMVVAHETTAQLQVSVDALTKRDEIINSITDPKVRDDLKAKSLQTQLNTEKATGAPPATDTFAQIKTIVAWSVVGLGVIALLNSGILQSAARAIPRRA